MALATGYFHAQKGQIVLFMSRMHPLHAIATRDRLPGLVFLHSFAGRVREHQPLLARTRCLDLTKQDLVLLVLSGKRVSKGNCGVILATVKIFDTKASRSDRMTYAAEEEEPPMLKRSPQAQRSKLEEDEQARQGRLAHTPGRASHPTHAQVYH